MTGVGETMQDPGTRSAHPGLRLPQPYIGSGENEVGESYYDGASLQTGYASSLSGLLFSLQRPNLVGCAYVY